MKIFLDDIRFPSYIYPNTPEDSWVVVRDYESFVQTVNDCVTNNTVIDLISFDHDLADSHDPERTGYTAVSYIEELIYDGKLMKPNDMRVHSANPVGIKRIMAVIMAINLRG